MLAISKTTEERLLLNEEYSDVVVCVQEEEAHWKFPAHSLFLRCGSEVLRQMLDNNEIEAVDDRGRREIILVGISPDIVILVLRFLYTKTVPSIYSEVKLLHLLSASIRCHMRELQSECESRLIRNIRIGNACSILKMNSAMIAHGHGSSCISAACMRIVIDYGQVVFSSDLVLLLNREHLLAAVRSPSLNIADERVVFEGLWRWGKYRCLQSGNKCTNEAIANELGDLLRCVRYSNVRGTSIPPVVRERYCKSTSEIGFCVMQDKEPSPRLIYHQPRDLLHQSSRFLLFYPMSPAYPAITSVSGQEGLDDRRLLCARVSYDCDLFLTALALQIFLKTGSSIADRFYVSVADNDVERLRQEVFWDEEASVSSSDVLVLSSTVRLPYPLPVRSGYVHTLHLLRQEVTANDEETANPDRYRFPATPIAIPGQSRSVTQFCSATFHCERIAAISAIYFIPADIVL